MKKLIWLTCLLPLIAQADITPIVTLDWGLDNIDVSQTRVLGIAPGTPDTYFNSNHTDTEQLGGAFVGVEASLPDNWAVQLGLSYYYTQNFESQGDIYFYESPQYNNLAYQYYILSQRVLAETKLLYTIDQHFHPYLTAGVGDAINKSYNYSYTYVQTNTVAPAPFANHTSYPFTYMVGAGYDFDFGSHVRLGAGYHFADLGSASLGTSSGQTTSNTLTYKHLYTNEFLIQLSILA